MVSLPAGTKVFDPQFVNCDATLVQHIDIPHRERGLFERTRPRAGIAGAPICRTDKTTQRIVNRN